MEPKHHDASSKHNIHSKPFQPIDVVIHCGDITGDSKISEHRAGIQLLREIEAPIKLVIPGNRDFTLDTPTFQQMCYESRRRLSREMLQHYYGSPGEARRLFDEARKEGIIYLDQGVHRLPLPNGASLTVYASPYTPSFGSPGFQYTAKQGHDFAIPDHVDVAITHGPPRGVLDRSWMTGEHVGSPELFSAVAKARPRLHCFGHIHEGWGAEVVTWGGGGDGSDQQARSIPRRSSSTLLADLGSILPLKDDADDMAREKEQRLAEYARGKCIKISHCVGDALPIEPGLRTLFVNAAVVGTPVRPPWVVDIELPVMQGVGDVGEE
ncbi:putative rhamnogalacturonate lyase C [Madurella mycetomatis]|uniref:Rhamnogalacturonate lyase C n=1 Tax=Madurella mycetomatis TaxID=100816 RepID=A0A175W391_9PEZI|nr:putative rhamnogalacturonate lyase C [Madurella mycetomatis]